jgi:hypothetical protein
MPLATVYAALAFVTPFSIFRQLPRHLIMIGSVILLLLISLWAYEVILLFSA